MDPVLDQLQTFDNKATPLAPAVDPVLQQLNAAAPAQQEVPPSPSYLDVAKAAFMTTPAGMALKANAKVGEALDRAAYNAGGAVTDLAAKTGLPPEASGALGYGTNLATQVLPGLGAGKVAELAFSPAARAMGAKVMQSALKPQIADLKSGDAAQAITTMLNNGYNATEGGVKAMQSRIAELKDQVDAAIKGSAAMINKQAVASRLQDTLDKFSKQVNPDSDIKTIRAAWDEFMNHPLLQAKEVQAGNGLREVQGGTSGDQIPVQLAQQLKQGTYRVIGDKPYGELSGAQTEAQKTLARGLKEEISNAVPEVAKPNDLQHELINAMQIAERRALIHGNNNMLGLAPAASSPGMFMAFLGDKNALLKSILARYLYSGGASRNAGQIGSSLFTMGTGQAPDPALTGSPALLPPTFMGVNRYPARPLPPYNEAVPPAMLGYRG